MEKKVRARQLVNMSLGLWKNGWCEKRRWERLHLSKIFINWTDHIVVPSNTMEDSTPQCPILASISISVILSGSWQPNERPTQPSLSLLPSGSSQFWKVISCSILKMLSTGIIGSSHKMPTMESFWFLCPRSPHRKKKGVRQVWSTHTMAHCRV